MVWIRHGRCARLACEKRKRKLKHEWYMWIRHARCWWLLQSYYDLSVYHLLKVRTYVYNKSLQRQTTAQASATVYLSVGTFSSEGGKAFHCSVTVSFRYPRSFRRGGSLGTAKHRHCRRSRSRPRTLTIRSLSRLILSTTALKPVRSVVLLALARLTTRLLPFLLLFAAAGKKITSFLW